MPHKKKKKKKKKEEENFYYPSGYPFVRCEKKYLWVTMAKYELGRSE